MLMHITNILSAEEQTRLVADLERLQFIDGRVSAGKFAEGVKNNRQLSPESEGYAALQQRVYEILLRNELFRTLTLPKYIHSVMFIRYGAGEYYGPHLDKALMGERPYRTDISFTLFLNDPDEYAGGELVLQSADGTKSLKMEANSVVVYPTGDLHWVNEVTRGERLVAVGWVESVVRDAGERAVLFDLHRATQGLFQKLGKSEELDLLSKSRNSLLRRWADT
jgi:PKHD-type hydroxylase